MYSLWEKCKSYAAGVTTNSVSMLFMDNKLPERLSILGKENR